MSDFSAQHHERTAFRQESQMALTAGEELPFTPVCEILLKTGLSTGLTIHFKQVVDSNERSSSEAERQLPKLNVAGSIPVSRSMVLRICPQTTA